MTDQEIAEELARIIDRKPPHTAAQENEIHACWKCLQRKHGKWFELPKGFIWQCHDCGGTR